MLQSKDQELTRRDPALHGLPYLLDPGHLLELLSAHIDTRGLSDFQLSYVRYKPGMNCLGRYEFQFDGQPLRAYAKAFGADAGRKLNKTLEIRHIESPFGVGRIVLPEQGLFLSFFPNDLKLRSIVRLGNPALRGNLLKRVFHRSEGWDKAADTILNYKPERRLVARLDKPGGQSATVKFYTRREFSRNMHVRNRQAKGVSVMMPRCIGASTKHCAYAFEWIPGATLRSYASYPAVSEKNFHKAGRLISRYHSGSATGLDVENDSASSQSLGALAGQLAFLLPELGDRARNLATDLQSRLGVGSAELCPVHGDFYDKQIIVGAGGLSLIDFDRAHLGSACEDIACFLAHQELLVIKNQATGKQSVSDRSAAFLAGYAEAGGHFEEEQLPGWIALHLLRLSHNPFRDRSPDWPNQTAKILQKAEEFMSTGLERSGLK